MNWQELLFFLALLIQTVFAVRWLYRKTRNDDVRAAFVDDMATNHLPHLYDALRGICGHLGIELKEPPPIQFVRFNGKK